MASNLYKPSMPEDFFSTNIENVCRICLQTDVPLTSIFRDEVDEMISEFLPDKVDLQDNFPQQICKKCLDDVKVAYAFKKQAEYSHEVIKKMLDGKRLPRSSNKKSYQEINENNIFRTKSLPSDPVNGTPSFVCHICDRTLLRKNILKKHLQRVHKFFDFEVYGDLFANSINRNASKTIKKEENESYIEEMTFPILPQVIMVDDDNDMHADENEEDARSIEEKDDPFKSYNEDINDSSNKLLLSTLIQDQQQTTFECHICYKRLTRRYYLKCHLERVHQFYDIDSIKPKLVPLKNSRSNDHSEHRPRPSMGASKSTAGVPSKSSTSTPSKSSTGSASAHSFQKPENVRHENNTPSFPCRICKKTLSRRYGLKKHYELVHNIVENDRPIDLTYDGSSDDHENHTPLKSFKGPKQEKIKTESIPNSKTRAKVVNVYICHICEKEFSGRATMRRHLKNVHKYQDFEDNIWLSKVYQKTVEVEEEVEEEPENVYAPEVDNEFDQSYKEDEDIDMHAYLLCPEVVLTTGDENNLMINNVKHAGNNDGNSSSVGSTSKAARDYNTEGSDNFKSDVEVKKTPNKVEPIKLKLDVLAIKNIEKPSNPPKIYKNSFACQFCKKPFNRYDHLKRHERTHTKPFSCRFCRKGFYRQDLLLRHEKAAHTRLLFIEQRNKEQLQQQRDTEQNINFNLDEMNANNEAMNANNEEYDSQEPNFDNENSMEDNEIDNFDDDDDDIEDEEDDQKNFEGSEQNSNHASSVSDANKEDSNPDTVESNFKDAQQNDDNSNSDAMKNSIRSAQDGEEANDQQNSNSYMDFDWSHIICLKSNEGYSLQHDSNYILIEKFQFVTQLKITKNDGMPLLFCNNCVAKLKVSYDFRRLCLNSDLQMRAFIMKINNEFRQFKNNAVKISNDSEYSENEMSILIEEGYKKENYMNGTNPHKEEYIIEQSICDNAITPSIRKNSILEENNFNEVTVNSCKNTEPITTPLHLTSAVQVSANIDDFTKYIQEDETEEEENNEMQSNCEQNMRDDYLIDSNEEIQMELQEENNRNNDIEDENSLEQDAIAEEIQLIDDNSQNNNSVDNEDTDGILGNSSEILFIQSDSQIQEAYRINDIMELPVEDQKHFLRNDRHRLIEVKSPINETKDEIFNNATDSNNSDELNNMNSPIKKYTKEIKIGVSDLQRNINRTHICIKCDKDFSTKTNLMRHMQTHDGIKPFQCNICGNGFTQNGSLKSHMLIHTGERPHQCNVCGRGFTQAKSLIFHMRRHTGEKPFSCSICGLSFRQKDGLKRHEQIKHANIPPENHTCTICNRTLHSRYSLQLHMRKHNLNQSESRTLECSECDKKFQSRFSLSEHQRTHTGEKPFKCEGCDKEFSRKTSLLTHLKTHQEENHFKCELCSKEFFSLKEYEIHATNHESSSSSKIFQCGKCFKSFSIKRNLLQHLRNHNMGLTDLYKCNDCSIGFNTKRGLKLHRYNEHKEVVTDLNECEYCNIPFVNAYDLNQHINNVHDIINEKCETCLEHFTSKKLYDDHMLEHEVLTIT
ncbi:uncharacterized protein LOC129605684 [Condylostylus longicornis]|uniref:uncharacterized protein LOC129605684 n=1 Tax=Condylostylus longicornis TaxID=2530218 RepID=UPI00244DBCBC|nr:uncharacterized protein LOC129605684 [Condylostylus longicornis]